MQGERNILRFKAEHELIVRFGIKKRGRERKRDHIRTFSVYSNRRVVCLAGNLVRWEIFKEKGKGMFTSLKELNLCVNTIIEKVPHFSGVQGVRAGQDFFHGFQALLF